MSDHMVFLTPNDVFGSGLMHPQMIRDLYGVAAVDPAHIEELADSLQAEPGFLTEERLGQIVAEHIGDEALASSVASAIQNLHPGILDQVLGMIGGWRDSSDANKNQFPDANFAALQEKLPLLVREYPALSRMRKASRLRGVLGNELERVEFICDARPVFDARREQIEGLAAITTMKLLYERQNGITEELEIGLTAKQLAEVIAKAQKAQHKLQVLEQSIDQWVNHGAV